MVVGEVTERPAENAESITSDSGEGRMSLFERRHAFSKPSTPPPLQSIECEADIKYFWAAKDETMRKGCVAELKDRIKHLRTTILADSDTSPNETDRFVQLLKEAPTEGDAKEVLHHAVESFPELLPTFRPVNNSKYLSELRRKAFRSRSFPSFRFSKSSILRDPARPKKLVVAPQRKR